tara:strand:- start:117 stop:764 length:648 start_codon:yes stop_codon:yes gene_type:complete
MEGQQQHSESDETLINNHRLNSKWVVWYHNPSDKSWNKDSYKDILELHTLEDYLVLKNSWDKCLPLVSEGMFFLMRKLDSGKVIYPQWEDVNNKDGGYWSFKIDKDEAQNVWFKLCSFTIGECICCNTMESLQVNGISISPKKNFCIIKIWNNNYKKEDIKLLSEKLSFLDMDQVKYSSHVKNIERDTTKQQKYNTSKKPTKKNNNNGKVKLGRF